MELPNILLLLIPFLLIPIVIILLGKIANSFVIALNKVASRTLIFHDYRLFFLLFPYYLVLSILMSFLIENSLLFEEFALTELEIALIALSLAFLPRVIGFTAAHEQTRAMIITILTPLLIFSLPMLFLGLKVEIIFPLNLVKYCLGGSLIFSVVGEFWIWAARKRKILKKPTEYQRADFIDDVRAKPWEQDWEGFIENFNDSDFEDDRPKIISAFKVGLEEAKKFPDLTRKIVLTLKNLDSSIETASKFFDILKEQVKEQDPHSRVLTAPALGEIGKVKPDEVFPILKGLVKDEAQLVRNAALDALLGISREKKEAVLPTVIEWAKDEAPAVRWAAAFALNMIGKEKTEAVLPTLKKLAKDKDPAVQNAALDPWYGWGG